MTPQELENREDARARLDVLGVEQVKLLMSHGGLPTQWHVHVYEWLGEKASNATNAPKP